MKKMNKAKLIMSFVGVFIVLSSACLADSEPPVLYNALPEDGGYILGKNTDLFSIRITEPNLDTGTANLNFRVEDPTSVWDATNLDCDNETLGDWICNATVPGMESLVADGRYLLYYFEANDTSKNYDSVGTRDDPLRVLIDRTPPIINFLIGSNEYVGVNRPLKAIIYDDWSGINTSLVSSPVQYMYGNQSWNSSWEEMTHEQDNYTLYVVGWDTLTLEDNSTWIVYINATDNVGNSGVEKILNIHIDNEYPSITIYSPSADDNIFSTIDLKINVKDMYSGIKPDYVSFVASSDEVAGNLTCEGSSYDYNCSGSLDTTQLSDGDHVLTFYATDYAENQVNEPVSITVDNKLPSISLLTPGDDSYVSGNVFINISVINVRVIKTAHLKWETVVNSSGWIDMTCLGNSSCYYYWETAGLLEGIYSITISLTNTDDYETNKTFIVTIDNTLPEFIIDSPAGNTVNGTIFPRVTMIDNYGVDPDTIRFNISGYSESMSCARYVQGKKYSCAGSFDTTNLADNYYDLTFYGSDLAGNPNSVSKRLLIDNEEGVGPVPNETTTTTVAGGTTTSTAAEGENGSTTSPLTTNPILAPIIFALKAIQDILEPWPVKGFAISMIVFLIVLAIMRNIQIMQKTKDEG